MCKVSVIMGVYNCKNFDQLTNSVKSIINQTYNDWEFIICDDGSDNGTYEHLQKLSSLDKRIKVFHYSNNKGLAYALNFCLSQARGYYIARQDDDDVSCPERFTKQIQFLKSRKSIEFVGCNAILFDKNGEWGTYLVKEEPCKEDFLWNNPFIHPSVIFRKSALIEVNFYRYAPETNRCEDYDLFMRMYAKNLKGYNLQEYLYRYQFDRNQKLKYRTFKDRFFEAKVRYLGYKNMNISFNGILFVFKPLFLGLIPQWLYAKIRFLYSNLNRQ